MLDQQNAPLLSDGTLRVLAMGAALLTAPALADVVACYRDPEEGDSRLVRLGDLERYPELVAQGPLGQLMTRRVLDRFLKDSTTG